MITHFPSIAALSPEASTLAMLMLGFGGFGLATFSVGMKVGQIAEAAWWKGKLQAREPPTLFRERRELGEGNLLRRPRVSDNRLAT
jgi:hypothetical protein